MEETAGWAEAIVIGTVTSSTARRGDIAGSTAVLEPKVFLKGTLPPGPFQMDGLTTDCMGNGPPLYEGEEVLLAIGRAGPSQVYHIHPLLKTVFEDGRALTDPSAGEPYVFGDPEAAVRRWAGAAGASDDATERAILAVSANQDNEDSFGTALIIGTCLVGMAAVAVVVLYRRRKAFDPRL